MSRRRRGHGATNDVVAATASPRAQDPDAGRKASRETRARAAPDPASTTTLTPLTRASYARAGPRRRHKNTVFRTRLSDPERVVQEDLRAVVRCAVAAPAHLRGRRVFCVDKSNPQQERRIERRVSRDRVTARPRRTARALRSLGRTILNSYSRSQREEATKIHAACFGCLPRVRFSSFFVCGCSSASDLAPNVRRVMQCRCGRGSLGSELQPLTFFRTLVRTVKIRLPPYHLQSHRVSTKADSRPGTELIGAKKQGPKL